MPIPSEAIYKFHDQERPPVFVYTAIKEAGDRRMFQGAQDGSLFEKARSKGSGVVTGVDVLDGALLDARSRLPLGAPHHAQTTFAQNLLELPVTGTVACIQLRHDRLLKRRGRFGVRGQHALQLPGQRGILAGPLAQVRRACFAFQVDSLGKPIFQQLPIGVCH